MPSSKRTSGLNAKKQNIEGAVDGALFKREATLKPPQPIYTRAGRLNPVLKEWFLVQREAGVSVKALSTATGVDEKTLRASIRDLQAKYYGRQVNPRWNKNDEEVFSSVNTQVRSVVRAVEAEVIGDGYSDEDEEADTPTQHLKNTLIIADPGNWPNPITRYKDLETEEARKAYRNFGYFRTRYFQRRNIRWQGEMVMHLMEWLKEARETNERGKGIVNTPPGGGKTTTITHDFPIWMIARNRNVRIALGSRTNSQSNRYVTRIRNTLERNALLNYDFGRFKPDRPALWRLNEFIVDGVSGITPTVEYRLALLGLNPKDPEIVRRLEDPEDLIHRYLEGLETTFMTGEKEPTVMSLAQEMGFLGGRYDINIWDDLCDRNNSRTAAQREALTEWWHAEAESRCEPGGLVVLVGTRFGKFDLYRHARELTYTSDDDMEEEFLRSAVGSMSDEEIEAIREDLSAELVDVHKVPYGDLANASRKTKHVYKYLRFPAHDESRCPAPESNRKADHTKCLLDPERYSWHDLLRARASDPRKYALTYQQLDEADEDNLVQEVWLTGGIDDNGMVVPGCYNYNRRMLQVPENLDRLDKKPDLYSVGTVDPSAINWWSVQWWLYDSVDDKDYLMSLLRARLSSGSFLDWNLSQNRFTGILEDWQTLSEEMGWPIKVWIIEESGAQKYLFQYSWVKEWQKKHKVIILPHQTTGRKSDPDFGLQTLGPRYRHGLVDLPFSEDDPRTRLAVYDLKKELTDYPEGETTDLIMGHWFLHYNRYRLPKSLRLGGDSINRHPYDNESSPITLNNPRALTHPYATPGEGAMYNRGSELPRTLGHSAARRNRRMY